MTVPVLLALALALGSSAAAGAAEKNTARPVAQKKTARAAGLGSSATPVQITSKEFEALDKKLIWTGNVVAVREDMTVRCDMLTADLDDRKEMKRLTCSGHAHMYQPAVRNQHEEREAWGDVAVFDNDTALLTVTGSPRSREGDNTMAGDKFVFDTATDKLHVDGKVRTTMTSSKASLLPKSDAKSQGRRP